ncbi:amidase [Methylicorpusculum sp.]|uniref:amidase n=1 Tax=Methylicorpusculum sp. TaxID=2713644 RepID=UPI00272091B2|nr:amidase [Methylicorpusculum sp.]MDO8845667.1 amidase [Methylicorpusculum sp.]
MYKSSENRWQSLFKVRNKFVLLAGCILASSMIPDQDAFANAGGKSEMRKPKFQIEEATIDDIHEAIKRRQLTTTELVHLYLDRIKAYNGVCVNQPEGILGPISTIPHAGKINALITLNLRPDSRTALGFDSRKARSMTDNVDNNPDMPDALEVAAELDAHFAKTGKLAGPLHGVVMAIKDQYDTFDMRTTAGADAFYANDRPPDDATFVKQLRDAGAIILAKANMGEYAAGGITGTRSSFGGTMCNPYDTERDPGASSGGSGMAVAANLVTCAIGEETGTSVREPAKNNNSVGIAPTRELVSADGMIQKGITTRVGPICRTVKDTARILDAYAGFDPKDELTAFSQGRKPVQPYAAYADGKPLDKKIRIGVIREYMDKDLFSPADIESIDIVDKAIDDLRGLGATIIDPGPGGALFQGCVDKVVPTWRNQLFISQFPGLFPAGTDHIPLLVDMYFDPLLVPHTPTGQPSIRNLGPAGGDAGDAKYNFNLYLKERGDANIQNLTELIEKANYWNDPVIPNRKASLLNADTAVTLANASALQNRFALQTVVFQCFAEMQLDAVVYPTGSVPPPILTAPEEPGVNDRPSSIWTFINARGFPAITVPAGFTTEVYGRDAARNLVGPIPAKLPVGIDFLGLPFNEAMLFKIAAAYEQATHHRTPPPDFGPLDKPKVKPGKPKNLPKARVPSNEELRAIEREL